MEKSQWGDVGLHCEMHRKTLVDAQFILVSNDTAW